MTVTVEKEGRTMCLQAGSARAEVDGEERPLGWSGAVQERQGLCAGALYQ